MHRNITMRYLIPYIVSCCTWDLTWERHIHGGQVGSASTARVATSLFDARYWCESICTFFHSLILCILSCAVFAVVLRTWLILQCKNFTTFEIGPSEHLSVLALIELSVATPEQITESYTDHIPTSPNTKAYNAMMEEPHLHSYMDKVMRTGHIDAANLVRGSVGRVHSFLV